MSHYRDGFAGAREQVAERRARVEELLRRLTPIHRAVYDMSPIDRAFERAKDETLPIQDVFTTLERLTIAIPFALEEAEALLAVRGEAPASMLGAATIGPDVHPLMARAVAHHGVEVFREDGGARALVTIDSVSISLAARGQSIGERIDFDGWTEWLLGAAAVAVPRSLPRVRVSLAAFGDGILAKLGIIEDHPVGDVVFDGTFRIRGDAEVARALLKDDVRKALLGLEPCAPVLDIHEGRAQVSWAERWSNDPAQVVRAEALEALLGISRAVRLSSKGA